MSHLKSWGTSWVPGRGIWRNFKPEQNGVVWGLGWSRERLPMQNWKAPVFQATQATLHFILYKAKQEGSCSLLCSVEKWSGHCISSKCTSSHGTRAEKHLGLTTPYLSLGDTVFKYCIIKCPLLVLHSSVAYYCSGHQLQLCAAKGIPGKLCRKKS